jgi:hypothetical protein
MSAFGAKMSLFFDDLKTSWYFRIWTFAWLFGAILTFIALIVLGQRATEYQKEQSWRLWIENAPDISYPSFYIKTTYDESANTISHVSCTWGPRDGSQMLVPTTGCSNGTPVTKCVYVDAQGYVGNQKENHLDCRVNTTAPAGTDKILLLQIYEQADFGATIVWLDPSDNAVVYLTKTLIEPHGKTPSILWGHSVEYHSTVVEGDYFNIRVAFQNFAVFHWQEDSGFDTWMSVGGIGGVAFFMVIMHTIFMTIIGMCLPNESKFLGGQASSGRSASDYQAVR